MFTPRFLSLAALAALPALAACSSDDVVAPPRPVQGSFTVNTSTGWSYVSLTDSAVVSPANPSADANWDIAFNAMNVMLNGGQAGPGGVSGFCICQNLATSPTNAQILAMTAESEKADFDAIATVPASASFTTETFTPAISGWYTGSGAAATATANRTAIVRLADGSSYAKVRVVSLANASAANAGRVTLEYAVIPNMATAFGAAKQITVDLATGAKRVDLNTDAAVTSGSDWDLQLDGWFIRLNGGASGNGLARAGVMNAPFASLTTIAGMPSSAFTADGYRGVFGTAPVFKYNLAGDHKVSPTFDVFLVKRGSAVYKLQVTGYYGVTGATRQISFRYAKIAG